jgi:hypothetical protein
MALFGSSAWHLGCKLKVDYANSTVWMKERRSSFKVKNSKSADCDWNTQLWCKVSMWFLETEKGARQLQ